MPSTDSAQLLLLLKKTDCATFVPTGLCLGKAEVYFIILQRQHLTYAAAEYVCTAGTAQSYPESSPLPGASPEANEKPAVVAKPTGTVTAAATFLATRKYFVTLILLPTKDVQLLLKTWQLVVNKE